MASAAALDSLNIIGMVGTIAGDDTIMCVMKDKNIGRTAIAEIDTVFTTSIFSASSMEMIASAKIL